MRGTIISRVDKSGRKSWGYSFFAGRDESGKRIQKVKRGFAKRGDAEKALAAALEGHLQPVPPEQKPDPEVPTFEAFFKIWMESYKAKCAPKTRERYVELGAYALKYIGHLPLDQIGVAEIDDMLLALERNGGQKTKKFPTGKSLSIKTVREIGFLVAGCFKKAVARKLISESPFAGDVQIPEAEHKEAKSLDTDQLLKLLQAAHGTRLYPLLMLASATGCRRGELLALTWADLDLDTGLLHVNKSLEETKSGLRIKGTKTDRPRSFRVPKQALDALTEWKAEQEEDKRLFGPDYADSGLIFSRPDGQHYRPDKVSVRVTALARKIGLEEVGLHSLRHTHASHLLSQGTPIPVVASRLGHRNPNVTLTIYSHALPADEAAAAEVWNNSLGKVIADSRKDRMLSNVIKIQAEKESSLLKSAS